MVREREEIPEEYKWDLEKVYENRDEWESDFEELSERVDELEQYRGRLGESGETLLEALKLREELMRKMSMVAAYARMRSHEDTRDQEHQAMSTRASSLQTELGSRASFFSPEIQEIGRERLEEMMSNVDELEEYEHYFDDVLRMKDHTLSEEVEELLADLGDVMGASEEVYSMLTNADLKFPEVTRGEEEVEITQNNFTTLLQERDRELRKEVYEKFYDRFNEYQHTIGTTIQKTVRKHVKLARQRNFESAREAALKPSSIPLEVYDNLVDTVESNLQPLQDHAELKKQILGVDSLEMYDIYMPTTKTESPEIEYEEAKKHVLEAIAPLGEEYQEAARKGLESRWVDVYENRGKRSGAYSGGTYDTPPYILMNYQGDINSMYTLAHELGHSMHSYFTTDEQPYIYGDYELFVAEVASTVNEALLTAHLLENVEDDRFRRHVLSHNLENFRNTLYRQTMFAAFEQEIHERVENGEALTPDGLDELYGEKKSKYYGLEADGRIKKEWMRIPHFYYNFYVYQYATGISAATALAAQIRDGDAEPYLEFLKSGSSKYPIQLLKDAGVDLTSSEPIEKAIETYADYVREMEKLV